MRSTTSVRPGHRLSASPIGSSTPLSRVDARRHVNRKALDEYASFTEQKTELKRRQEENARGEAKIKQLIQTLDLRKDEAIERTFKVSEQFVIVRLLLV